MSGKIRPVIKCHKLQNVQLDKWEAIESIFTNADFAHFQQGWNENEEAAFRPAKAAAGWTDAALIVYAVLADNDIFNEVQESEFNRLSIEHGDVFEIFLKPEGQQSYFEIHINPNNQKFQLRIPYQNAFADLDNQFKSSDEMIESLKVWNHVCESRVKVDHDAGKWQVAAAIPFAMLVEGMPVKAGSRWNFSFSRYDYTRPLKEPVYSSTSPHPAVNYHSLDEYGFLNFI